MKANIAMLEKHRGKKFLLKDLKPYLKTVGGLKAADGQNDTVFALHRESVHNHLSILEDLTDTINYADEPYTEHLQGPALMEILYDMDPSFRKFVERFIKRIDECEKIVGKEGERKYTGFYGPVCVADFALTPGSTANVLNRMMRGMKLTDKERYYAQVVLASKSWGMNTSYVFGWRYIEALKEGKTTKDAAKEEIEMLKYIFESPLEAQAKLMDEVGAFPFGTDRYLKRYKENMRETTEKAVQDKVNYANILSVPAYAVGDIGHHLCQSTYDMYKDDFALEMLEGVVEVVEDTLHKGMDDFKDLPQILSTATGSAAAAVTYMLESEGYTSDVVIELLMKRFQGFIRKYPYRGVGIEFHNVDFMDVAYRGNKILEVGNIKGIPLDYTPLVKRGIVRDFKGCIYPNCAINRIFSTLIRFADHFCLLNIEPVTMALLTNIIAREPENSMSPVRGCKKCAASAFLPHRCGFCERTKAI